MSRERLAVIGDPIGHSLSPAMQSAALAAAGLDWTYEAHRVSTADLGSWVERARREGYRGFNVTIPHKLAICRYVDDLALSAARVGAVNTVVRQGDRLIGHNTDLAGFMQALLSIADDLSGTHAVVFGAGGSARAVVFALADLHMRTTIVNRSLGRASALAREVERATALASGDQAVYRAIQGAGLVVNATPLGMGDRRDQSPLPAAANLRPDTVVVDLVYGPTTWLIEQARVAGCRHTDGLEMLVRQGGEAFRLWTGIDPDFEVMRRACRERLYEHA